MMQDAYVYAEDSIYISIYHGSLDRVTGIFKTPIIDTIIRDMLLLTKPLPTSSVPLGTK